MPKALPAPGRRPNGVPKQIADSGISFICRGTGRTMHGTIIRDEDLRLRARLRIHSQRNDIIVLLSGRCMLGADGAEHGGAEHCVNAMLGVPWTLVLRLGPLVRTAAHQMFALLASECLVAAVMHQGFGG